MIRFERVTKRFTHQGESVTAIDVLSLSIHSKEVFGIVGESGSGKSTLLRMINTLVTPDQESVLVNEVDWFQENEEKQRKQRKKIGMIFQQFNLLANQSIFQNVALPLKLQKNKDNKRVIEVLDFVNLPHKATNYPSQLTGGENKEWELQEHL